jgi:hypothetical protein
MSSKLPPDLFTRAAAVLVLTLSVSALVLSATADHAALFATRPLTVPLVGPPAPPSIYHLVIPLLIAATHRVAIRSDTVPLFFRVILTISAVWGLGAIWLTDLALHDRRLTLLHCLLLLVVLYPRDLRSLRGGAFTGLAAAGGLAACISYGAIWGETRCDEPSPVRCLTDTGLRVWIPRMLEGLGVRVFADLRSADLSGAILRNRDLRYADLSGSDLRGADLADTNLRRARMEEIKAAGSSWRSAYLDGATVAGADMRDVDMRRVHAYRLDLRAADLTGADLRDASLSHVYLAGTRLEGARLQGAYLRYSAGLTSSQLSRACGDADTRLPPELTLPACDRH